MFRILIVFLMLGGVIYWGKKLARLFFKLPLPQSVRRLLGPEIQEAHLILKHTQRWHAQGKISRDVYDQIVDTVLNEIRKR